MRGNESGVGFQNDYGRDDSNKWKDACQKDMKSTGPRAGEEMNRAALSRRIIRYPATVDDGKSWRKRHTGLTCCRSVRQRRPLTVQLATQCAESDGASFPDPHRHYRPAQCTLGMKYKTLNNSMALNHGPGFKSKP